MTKHMRLIISVLFIVIIVLAVAITRFYSNTDQSAELSGTQPAVEKKLSADNSGNHIFTDSAGLYGIIDSNERVIVYPEWQEIKFTDSDLCIASKQIRGNKLFGCIDYEGNIAIPFVYSDITDTKLSGRTFYIAKSNNNIKDGVKDDSKDKITYVIYDHNFNPCFSRVWTSYKKDENELVLTSENGVYRYSVTANDVILRNAVIKSETMDHAYELEVTNKNLLSKLSISSLEKMSRAVDKYIEYAFTGNSRLLTNIDAEQSAVFLTLFPEDHSVTSKTLMSLNDVSVYSSTSDDDLDHYKIYITANISTNSKMADGKIQYLRGDYKAVMEFVYDPEKGLRVLSGDFVPNKLSYPAKAAESKQPADTNEKKNEQQAH